MTATEIFTLPKNRMHAFLGALSGYKLYAPVLVEGVLLFDLITDLKKFSCDAALSGNPVKPPKALLFPQTETMFRFNVTRDVDISVGKDNEGERIIFGIHSCDARSFLIFDQVFDRDPSDPYYANRRRKTVIIGIACNIPGANCFCTSVGGGPASKEGLDVLFTDLGDRYVVETVTTRGKVLIKQVRKTNPDLMAECQAVDIQKALELHKSAEEKMPRNIDLDGMPKKLARLSEHQFWSDISSKCIACGICTYLCPTCYCFDIQDEAAPLSANVYKLVGKRVRVWDSCMFPEYTLQASGYNPRPLRIHRIKNRIYHKYKWHPENFKSFACVGCGRCIDFCPVNVDIVEILSKVKAIRD